MAGWQPPTGRRHKTSPVVWLIITLLVILAGVVVAGLISQQNGGTPQGEYQNEDYQVPPVDTAPSEPPIPETYDEATRWMQQNSIYDIQVPVPTRCESAPIDLEKASKEELEAHFNEFTACLMRVWDVPLQQAGYDLPRPGVTIYESAVRTQCGELPMQNAVYCGADQQIYVAADLPDAIPPRLQSLPYSSEVVVAHEFSHHIQMRTGILISTTAWEDKSPDQATANDFGRRLEQQADCWAGMFLESAGASVGVGPQQIPALSNLFYEFGDDVLTGDPVYDGNHGSGVNRQKWFQTGANSTLMGSCNTYVVSSSEVR